MTISKKHVTRSQETEQEYRRRVSQLVDRFKREAKGEQSRAEWIAWLEFLRERVTANSWRYYRAALVWSSERQGKHDMAIDIARIATSQCIKRTAEPLGHRRTSSNKQKSLTVDDRQKIHEALSQSTSTYAAWVMLLLEGGRIAGLRPIEWPSASLVVENGAATLTVRNAKRSNGRSHGEERTLVLTSVGTREMEVIEHLLEAVKQTDQSWSSIYSGSRKLMHRLTRKLWPRRRRHPTLYSARHQFAADAKAAGLSRAEVAALMGHGADRTAGEHYGRRSSGNGGFRVAAVQAEVDRVRETARQRPAPATDTLIDPPLAP